MEDALARTVKWKQTITEWVLILVVMEDALAHKKKNRVEDPKSLNPCCNGRCTRTVR